MSVHEERVRRHYEGGPEGAERIARVCEQIDAMTGPVLRAAQTAALDQFHIRGLLATDELAQLVEPKDSTRVLDAGCGLGGPSRYLAETRGCSVHGVDLTPPYVHLARHLARRSPASSRLRYDVADLRALPVDSGNVDVVWTQHAMMNVRDRLGAYREFYRVLKRGGRLACYDVFAAQGKPPIEYPLPWASEAEASYLLTQDETVLLAAGSGFLVAEVADVTRLAVNWFGQQPMWHEKSLSLASVMGPRMYELAANLTRNLRAGHLEVAMFIFERDRS